MGCLCLGCPDPSHQEALWVSPGDSSWTRSKTHGVLLLCKAQRASLGLGLSAKRPKGTVDSTPQLPSHPFLPLQQELLTVLETRMFPPQSHHPYRPMHFFSFSSLPSSPFLSFCCSLPFWFLFTGILRATHLQSEQSGKSMFCLVYSK